ncbi:MAG TPA: esterase-like activity of phytase family protein [Acidiferrobacterales bacterium]
MSASLPRLTLLLLGLLSGAPAGAQDAAPALAVKRVSLGDGIETGARLGRLRILGMLQLGTPTIDGIRFAELSGLAWDDDGGLLYAVNDQGGLFALRPVFNGDHLVDVKLVKAHRLREPGDGKPVKWRRTDAEGLDIFNGRNGRKGDAELLVSFETRPRILRYRTDGTPIRELPLPAVLADVDRYPHPNRSLESVCVDPGLGILTAPEQPMKHERAGRTRIFALSGKSWPLPLGPGGIVALECLGNGELLILERDFDLPTLHHTLALRRTRIAPDLPDGALLPVSTVAVLKSSDGLKLDNFEGLARHRGNRFFLASDNNDVFLQRTLLLYVEIDGGRD